MDLRHGFCHNWRRSSPAPLNVRTCTPASAVTPVQRRFTSRQGRVKQGLPATFAVAVDRISQSVTAEADPVYVSEVPSQGSCSLDAACPAVLQTRLSKAHSSAASAALVVQDMPEEKLVATASLDKGMAIWRFYSSHGESESMDDSLEESIEVTRLKVPGAPVFSLAKIPEVLPDGTIVRKRPKPPGIYLGTASKEVLTWMLGSKDVTDKVVLDGHTGWVRSLAVTGKWLFSCGCNYLRLWDTTFRTPKECDAVRLFTGDILAITASDGRVFTAGADGSLRSWIITRAGDLQEGPSRERAHDGRISACIVTGGRVFTVSYDGSIKAWSAEALELVAEVREAHDGEKIFCVAVGSNGVVFTGGDDKLVRAWDQDLRPVGPPLEGHGASVRVLSAGRRALLVSGDADGDVCFWETYPVELPSTPRQTNLSAWSESWVSDPVAVNGIHGSTLLPGDLTRPCTAVAEEAAAEVVNGMPKHEEVVLEAAQLQMSQPDEAWQVQEPVEVPLAIKLEQLFDDQAAASSFAEHQQDQNNQQRQWLGGETEAELVALPFAGGKQQQQLVLQDITQDVVSSTSEDQGFGGALIPAAAAAAAAATATATATAGDLDEDDATRRCSAGIAYSAAEVEVRRIVEVDSEIDSLNIRHLDGGSQVPLEATSPLVATDRDHGVGGGFAVHQAAAISGEDSDLVEDPAAAEEAAATVNAAESPVCQIEVESVASAFAMACIAKDPTAATAAAAAGGRGT